MRKSEIRKLKAESWSAGPRCAPAFRFPLSALMHRNALTLIELLVVIVILTTLVAGVIPILSPNNDARKISAATRGLQTYIMMAQAEAARTGLPHGISFRESSPGSGVALEVFQVSVPPMFSGFSNDSRVTVVARTIAPLFYGSGGGNGGSQFIAQHDGAPLYNLEFLLAATSPISYDPFPPRMFRIGDKIDVGGNLFMIVDDNDPSTQPNKIDSLGFLVPDNSPAPLPTHCIWLNSTGQVLPSTPTALRNYQFQRQPMVPSTFAVTPGATAEAPYQLPAGVAIDLQGSVVMGGNTAGTPLFPGSFDDISDVINPPTPPNLPGYDMVSILFSPSGTVSSIMHNSQEISNASRVVLLLGRVENGALSFEWSGGNVTNAAWVLQNNTQDELEQKQEQVNWLNLDSRWLSIALATGRVVVSENAFVDARLGNLVGANDSATAGLQIEAAQVFAREMKSAGAGR